MKKKKDLLFKLYDRCKMTEKNPHFVLTVFLE